MTFKIGNIEIENQVVLAPMAGISNPSFIRIAEEMGVGLAYTEMISAEAIVRGNKKTFDMLKGIEKLNIPIGIQLFGDNPKTMAKAAKIVVEACGTYQKTFVDINMGCPVPKVATRAQAGSALLKDPDKVFEIVKAVVDSVNVPVTVKIRSGWDANNINAVEIAKTCEKAGAMAITVHGRTRSQGYSGKADWNIIKEVKESVSIPVIGNGDIKTCFDAERMLKETGCDAVMIGRGVLGNPWLIRDTVKYLENGTLPLEVTKEEKIQMIKKHLDYLLKTKPEKVALLEMRTHASNYLKGLPKNAEIKQAIFKTKTKEEFLKIIDLY